jgi:hypothetical protein
MGVHGQGKSLPPRVAHKFHTTEQISCGVERYLHATLTTMNLSCGVLSAFLLAGSLNGAHAFTGGVASPSQHASLLQMVRLLLDRSFHFDFMMIGVLYTLQH